MNNVLLLFIFNIQSCSGNDDDDDDDSEESTITFQVTQTFASFAVTITFREAGSCFLRMLPTNFHSQDV